MADQIISDLEYLKTPSKPTTLKRCAENNIFERLEKAMLNFCMSQRINGVGLAAIQIGLPIQAAIIRTERLHLNFINPVILQTKTPIVFKGEGCLSLPGHYCKTHRYRRLLVRYMNDKNKVEQLWLEDFEAVVMQHEVDHMRGRMFLEHKYYDEPIKRVDRKVGRNEPCPCKSEKKYKKCCGV